MLVDNSTNEKLFHQQDRKPLYTLHKNSIFEIGKITGKTNFEILCDMSIKLAETLASQLPIGRKVMVSRDYSRSALMSSAIDIIDVKGSPISVMCHDLSTYNSNNRCTFSMVYCRDDLSGEIVMLWVFLHAIKDYYDIAWYTKNSFIDHITDNEITLANFSSSSFL